VVFFAFGCFEAAIGVTGSNSSGRSGEGVPLESVRAELYVAEDLLAALFVGGESDEPVREVEEGGREAEVEAEVADSLACRLLDTADSLSSVAAREAEEIVLGL